MYALGSVYVRQGNSTKAQNLFEQVKDACEKKNKQKHLTEPSKPVEPKTTSKHNTASSKAQPMFKAKTGSQANQDVSNEARSEKKPTRWNRVELDTIANLSLLYANQDQPKDASETYKHGIEENRQNAGPSRREPSICRPTSRRTHLRHTNMH